MKILAVPAQFNSDLLRDALNEIDKAGVPEGLATYLVAVTEYLFRLKVVDEEEIQKIFMDIETAFTGQIDERIVYHIVKALEPSIRKTIKEEGRIPIAFNPFGKTPDFASAVTTAGESMASLMGSQQNEPRKRIVLGELAPRKSGPLPWIAPWVAGSAINELLARKGVSGTGLAFNLVVALHGKATFEEGDFRKREKSLKGEALTKFIDHYKDELERHLYNETLIKKEKYLTWEEIIFAQWESDNFWYSGHSKHTFYHDEKLVFELFKRYDTSGRVKGNKGLKKGRKK